jgi:hypothetical protein
MISVAANNLTTMITSNKIVPCFGRRINGVSIDLLAPGESPPGMSQKNNCDVLSADIYLCSDQRDRNYFCVNTPVEAAAITSKSEKPLFFCFFISVNSLRAS